MKETLFVWVFDDFDKEATTSHDWNPLILAADDPDFSSYVGAKFCLLGLLRPLRKEIHVQVQFMKVAKNPQFAFHIKKWHIYISIY